MGQALETCTYSTRLDEEDPTGFRSMGSCCTSFATLTEGQHQEVTPRIEDGALVTAETPRVVEAEAQSTTETLRLEVEVEAQSTTETPAHCRQSKPDADTKVLTPRKKPKEPEVKARGVFEEIEEEIEEVETEEEKGLRRIDKLWRRWVNQEHPKVFNHLDLAKDGGFTEVKGLYSVSRWPTAFILIAFVAYNLYYVIALDRDLIWYQDQAAFDIGLKHIDAIEDRFYLSSNFTDWAAKEIFGLPDEHVPDSIQIIGFLELLWLDLYLAFFIFSLLRICFNPGFLRWFYTSHIFWHLLPTMSTYSAIKLLGKVHPTVFAVDLYDKIHEMINADRSKFKLAMSFVFWIFSLLISFIIGFDTFLLKLRVVSSYARKDVDNYSFMETLTHVLLPCVQFVFQTMGVVQLGPFVQKRLFVFIFGGEDGILQPHEVEVMETWTALLAKRIWRDHSTLQFLAVMCSFSDEDFQSLVLNEDDIKREKSIGEHLERKSA